MICCWLESTRSANCLPMMAIGYGWMEYSLINGVKKWWWWANALFFLFLFDFFFRILYISAVCHQSGCNVAFLDLCFEPISVALELRLHYWSKNFICSMVAFMPRCIVLSIHVTMLDMEISQYWPLCKRKNTQIQNVQHFVWIKFRKAINFHKSRIRITTNIKNWTKFLPQQQTWPSDHCKWQV